MPEDYATPSQAPRRRWFVPALLAAVIVAGAAGLALARTGDSGGTGGGATGAVGAVGAAPRDSASSSPPATGGEAPKTEPQAYASTRATPKKKKTKRPTTSAPTTSPPAEEEHTGPRIVHFGVAQSPSCPSGTDQVQYEGQPVVLSWKVEGAESVTVSIDGPGAYGSYGPSGSESFPFSCGGDPGSYQKHTYLLTVEGGPSDSVTVKARVHGTATT